uniref:Putative secreted protein n=1 Tax=Anopheles darlingi TaxID=43151 RepID=A0A2M4DLG6_ANODA
MSVSMASCFFAAASTAARSNPKLSVLTSRWFSDSHVSRIVALRLKRAANCSSFSCRISSSRRASSRSCSAFSNRSQALLMSEIILPSRGVYGF